MAPLELSPSVPARSVIDLPVDLSRLLASLSKTLQKCAGTSRELDGALSLIQRWRTESSSDACDASPNLNIDAELALIARRSAALVATRRADELTADQARRQHQDEALFQDLMRRKVYSTECGHLKNLNPISGGYSKQTTFFDWICEDGSCHPYVVRGDVPNSFFGTSVVDEFPIVDALFRAGIPVAEPVLLQEKVSGVTEAFMISRRMRGRSVGSPTSGFGGLFSHDPTPALAQVLAKLHTLPLDDIGLGHLRQRDTDCDVLLYELDLRLQQYEAHRETPSSILDAAFTWLRHNANFGAQPAVLNHGDCNLYNLLFDDTQFVALLDWELAAVMSPAWDLAFAREGVETFGSFDRFLTLYQQAGGPKLGRKALAYFEVYRLVRGAVGSATCVSLFNRGAPLSLELVDMCASVYSAYISQIPQAIHACEKTVD